MVDGITVSEVWPHVDDIILSEVWPHMDDITMAGMWPHVDDITMAGVWPRGRRHHKGRGVASWWMASQWQECGPMVNSLTVAEACAEEIT